MFTVLHSRWRQLLASSCLVAPIVLNGPVAQAQQIQELAPITVTASRLSNGIVGASTSVITADDIARSPAQSVPDIIAQVPGVQVQTLYGGANGVGTSIDLRGFGAVATANTLVLINGRRVNDLDQAGVDLSTIPRDSIERIEITRGNSGAVLYGDNAVGGVINIVTKVKAGPPVAMRIEGGTGSFNQRIGSLSAAVTQGPWSSSVYGSMFTSDGYRANNASNQVNGIGDVRYATPDFTTFLTLSGDKQHLGFPGPRTVDPSIGLNQLLTNRRGTNTPFDYGDKQGANATTGFTKTLWDGGELIVDGGVRNKQQQAGFFGNVPLQSFNFSYVDSTLTTWSITPRLSIKNPIFGLPSNILTGIDYYDATYHSDRPAFKGAPPVHVYDLSQQTLAAYWQQTVGILSSTDISYGGRVQRTSVTARDRLDPAAPNYFGETQAAPLDDSETNHALHIGLEHRFNETFSVFGRAASAFRTPNVDERVAAGPLFDANFNAAPRDFTLKTQTSHDIEGGFRVKAGRFEAQSSVYTMDLTNEIQFDPVNFFNRNLDPTRRYGSETMASLRASDSVLLRGGLAYTRAVFREGAYTGNDVPLVSRFTANAGVTWNVWEKYVVVDATVRYWSRRRMDNDQANTQSFIPANATVDVKLSGEYDRFFWSVSANNMFNALYYDYAVASTFTPGRFNAYPLPGRTYMVKAGARF
ncbi:TonB-dependent receptor [Bradyrhizobium prioriisuperbiae]|uniref:TonB-dependent receptor n=1 Tax=Bradyrhizobium prioriisuperbiae TaxID=2854389 RepID=UPI0028E1D13A|nr:TonB-dependent receptor [Bradyrhizobium prioritasuperba]